MSGQIYYTSCRRGLSPGSGFQIRAATPGISPEDQELAVRLGVHKSLHSPGSTPDAFRAVPLASGKLLLQYSRYLGQDYSGRDGNFFTHSLLIPGDPPLWAVDYADWPLWKGQLAEQEDASAPVPLPEISPDPGALRASFGHRALSSFLKQDPRRKAALQGMLADFFLPPQDRRRLIIRDTRDNTPFWIACLTKCFPRAASNGLAFSTYQYDPAAGLDIMGTVPGSGCDPDDPRLREVCRFYDFTIPEALPSELEHGPEEKYYAERVTGWLFSAPERLSAFLDFMEVFDRKAITPELCSGLRLFEAVRTGAKPAPLKSGPCPPFSGTSEAFPEPHAETILRSFRELEPTRLRRSFPAVLLGLRECRPPRNRKDCLTFSRWWIDAFNACLRRHAAFRSGPQEFLPPEDPDAPEQWLRLGEDLLKEALTAASFAQAVREDLDMEAATAAMKGLLPPPGLRLLRLIHICFLSGAAADSADRDSPSWNRPPLLQLGKAFTGTVPARHTALLGLLPGADRALWLRDAPGECAGEALRLYARQAPEDATKLRSDLDDCGAQAVLIAEWRALLNAAEDKQACFSDYLSGVVSGLSGAVPLLHAVCLTDLAESLPDPEIRNRAVLSGLLQIVPQAYERLSPRCLEQANAGCAFVPPASPAAADTDDTVSEAVRILGQAAHSLGCKLTPDRPSLHLLEKLLARGRVPAGWLLAAVASALPFLDQKEYAEYLRRVMPLLAAVPFACCVRCLRLLYRDAQAPVYAQRLAAALKTPARRPHLSRTTAQDLWALPMAAFELTVLEPPEALENAGSDVESLYGLLRRLTELAPSFHILCEHKVKAHPGAAVQERWRRLAASGPLLRSNNPE